MLEQLESAKPLVWVRWFKQELEEFEANGYCQHGKSKVSYSLDMERDCFACEIGDDRNIYREALSRAKEFKRVQTVMNIRKAIDLGFTDWEIVRIMAREL